MEYSVAAFYTSKSKSNNINSTIIIYIKVIDFFNPSIYQVEKWSIIELRKMVNGRFKNLAMGTQKF